MDNISIIYLVNFVWTFKIIKKKKNIIILNLPISGVCIWISSNTCRINSVVVAEPPMSTVFILCLTSVFTTAFLITEQCLSNPMYFNMLAAENSIPHGLAEFWPILPLPDDLVPGSNKAQPFP